MNVKSITFREHGLLAEEMNGSSEFVRIREASFLLPILGIFILLNSLARGKFQHVADSPFTFSSTMERTRGPHSGGGTATGSEHALWPEAHMASHLLSYFSARCLTSFATS